MDFPQAHLFIYTKQRIKEEELKQQMEVMRLQTFYMLKPHLKDSINKPSKLMPFHWEIEPILDVEAVNFDAFDRLFQKRLLKKKENNK